DQPVSVLFELSARMSAAGGDARELCRRIQREYPGDFWANYQLGNELDHHRDPEAMTYYMAALSIRPKTLAVYMQLVPDFAFHGRDSEAIEYGKHAVALEPTSVIARVVLAGIYLQLEGHGGEAIAECEAAIELDPSYLVARSTLGGALLKQGRFADAGAVFEKYAEMAPPNGAQRTSGANAAATCKRLASEE